MLAAVALGAWGIAGSTRQEGQDDLPSIVLVITDDQRWDSLEAMPSVNRHLVGRGVSFEESFVVDPLCCPSRASTLTGSYPHATGVWANDGPYGGFERFRDGSTLATWLDDRGYRTALMGKYLNQYEETGYVPPGWDRWVAFAGSEDRRDFYYRYWLNSDGRLEWFGGQPSDYSTDVLADRAVSFVRETRGPLFLYFSPYAPHDPGTPAPRDTGAFDDLPPWRPDSYNEPDMSDKPLGVRSRRPMDAETVRATDELRRDMMASLLAVDRAVERIVDALADTGRLDESLIVFTSDNGFSWGEHRWVNKVAPWEESIRVPLVVRFDPLIEAPRTDQHLVLNVDLAPTFSDLAGARSPGAEGSTLLPLLLGREVPWREEFGIESFQVIKAVPSYCAVRTRTEKLVAYVTGELEYYDLGSDPLELRNRATDPVAASAVRRLGSRLEQLCRPPPGSPPGFP